VLCDEWFTAEPGIGTYVLRSLFPRFALAGGVSPWLRLLHAGATHTAGMKPNEMQRPRELEVEKRRLKKIVAKQAEIQMLSGTPPGELSKHDAQTTGRSPRASLAQGLMLPPGPPTCPNAGSWRPNLAVPILACRAFLRRVIDRRQQKSGQRFTAMQFRAEEYYQAGLERMRQAITIHRSGKDYALAMYCAGLAVESMLRAFRWVENASFEGRHDLNDLLEASGIVASR